MAVTMPGLEDRFRAPRSVSSHALVTIARGSAADAVQHKDEFIRRGLPKDFLEDLNKRINAYEAYISKRMQHTEEHVAATAGIDDLIEDGLSIMRELDPVVLNVLADDPAAQAAWASASHVERAQRSPRKEKTDGERSVQELGP